MGRIAIRLKRAPWPVRLVRRFLLRYEIRWIETDIAADYKLLHELPSRIHEHERVAAGKRVELALLEDTR